MTILFDIFLILHFIGLASLLGGFMTQMHGMRTGHAAVNAAMLHGALTMAVSGIVLFVLGAVTGHIAGGLAITKYVIKTVVLLIAFGLILRYRREKSAPTGAFAAIGALTLLDVVIAVAMP
ncbi:MAG: hypothetical protein LKF88_01840 [Microbacteriaceae bacterium]|jgi:uncharacterized membrane protein SirB2|nr:hypothetical protein [Microbacteriaceae bacterium]MCI1207577.1 hypothetical protein [Microbacteriaceae bacterium]